MISSHLYLLMKIGTRNRVFANSACSFISCGCQNIQNKYLLGIDHNKIKFSTIVTPTTSTTPPKKKKTVPIPKITLIQGDEVLVTSLENAQKISKRRNLKLVKIVDIDTKTERPVYKIMAPQEYHEEDLKQREQKKKDKLNKTIKGEKILMLNQTISEHDLQTQINKIIKWIERSYEVKVVIHGEIPITKAEGVYSNIEKAVGELGKIVQKRQKETDIKFQILPPKKQQSNESAKFSTSDGDSNKPKSD